MTGSKIITFLVAFAVTVGLLYWWQSARYDDKPAPAERTSLLDFEDEYEESVEVAHWIFDNHECSSCHTLSDSGILGLTDLGKTRAEGFQGCPGLLTTTMETVGLPEAEWTLEQKQARADFKAFGCETCHQVGESSLELTEIGSKAAVMHMSCSGVFSQLTATTDH